MKEKEKDQSAHQSRAPGERPIHMWERVERGGKIFYVPLDKDLRPLSDIALQDVQESPHEDMSGSDNFLLVRGIGETDRTPRLAPQGVERIVVRAIRRILEDNDTTTYQVCETLVRRLTSADFGDGLSVDVAGLLQDNFWYYEAPSTGGYMVRKWTLDQERAKAYWKSQKKNLPGSLIFPPIDMYN